MVQGVSFQLNTDGTLLISLRNGLFWETGIPAIMRFRNVISGMLLLAVASVLHTETHAQRYDMLVLDSRNGLVGSEVNDIAQDPLGYLWIATNDGVSRYDGSEFVNYNHHNGLSENHSSSIFCDSQHRIWVGHQSGGLSVIDGDSIWVHTEEDGLANHEVHDIFEDSEGKLWIATFGGVSVYSNENWKSKTIEDGLASNNIQSICEDVDGNIWLGTYGSGINILKGEEVQHLHRGSGLINNYITDLYVHNGKMLISTLGGLSIWSENSFNNRSAADRLIKVQVNQTSVNHNGDIWLATFNGIDRVRNGQRLSLSKENGLPNNEVLCVFHDTEGNTWLGTRKGLVRIKNLAFAHYNSTDDLDLEPSFLFKDSKGRLWAGNEEGGVLRFDGHTFQRAFKDPDINDHQISSIGEDGEGNLWFGTMDFGGLFRWNGKKLRIYSDESGLADHNINCLLRDVDGSMLIGTFNGLSRFDGTNFQIIYLSDDITSNHITTLELTSDGTVLAGTTDGSIFLIQDGEVKTKINLNTTSPITDIFESPMGLAFATQTEGIFFFEDGPFFEKAAPGLQLSSSHSLAYVDNSLFVGTANGLLQVQKNGDSILVNEFREKDGFLNATCKFDAMLWDGSNLWIGTTNGITRFSPTERRSNNTQASTFLTEIQLSWDRE